MHEIKERTRKQQCCRKKNSLCISEQRLVHKIYSNIVVQCLYHALEHFRAVRIFIII